MDNPALFDFTGQLILKEILCLMDGGSVIVRMTDSNSKLIEVTFIQTMILIKEDYSEYPGSLLVGDTYVPIRSDLEKKIIKALKELDINKLDELEKQIVKERISFVESDKYIEVAKKVGRIH